MLKATSLLTVFVAAHFSVTCTGGQSLMPSSSHDLHCMNLPDDFYPSPWSCNQYFICKNQAVYRVECAPGLHYNAITKHCDWPSNVHCVIAGSQPTSVATTTTPAAMTIAPSAATTGQPRSASAFCASRPNGRYREPSDCNLYVECLMRLGFVGHCPKDMVFNQAMGSCQHPSNTPECANYHSANIG